MALIAVKLRFILAFGGNRIGRFDLHKYKWTFIDLAMPYACGGSNYGVISVDRAFLIFGGQDTELEMMKGVCEFNTSLMHFEADNSVVSEHEQLGVKDMFMMNHSFQIPADHGIDLFTTSPTHFTACLGLKALHIYGDNKWVSSYPHLGEGSIY